MSIFTPDGQYDNAEIRQRLFEGDYSDGWVPLQALVDSIIQQFWFRDYMNSLVAQPAFLEHLKAFLNATKPTHFNRFDFYTFFFEQLFDQDQLTILKKVGVVFELMQKDTHSINDFTQLLTQLGNDEITIEDLKQASLVVDHEENSLLRWSHHSLTEFLGAIKILDGKDILKTASKLILLEHEGISSIKPSWYGVIRFLLESEGKENFAKWLVDLAEANPEIIDEIYSDTLTSVIHTNAQSPISHALQRKIFFLIYDNYKTNLLWLSVWTRNGLGSLLDASYIPVLKTDLAETGDQTRDFVQRGNVVAIIGYALPEQEQLFDAVEKEFWKEKFVSYANDANDNGVLQRHSLHALEYFEGEPEIVDKVAETRNSSDSLVREAFVQLCGKIAVNYPQGIDYIINVIKAGSDIYGRHALYNITSREGVLHLLQKFIDDADFLEQFLDKDDIFNYRKEKADDELLKHIEGVANEEVIEKLKNIILKAFSLSRVRDIDRAYFLKRITLLVVDKAPLFYQEVLAVIENEAGEKERWDKIFDYEHLFPLLLTPQNLSDFSQKLSKLHERGKREVELAIYSAKRVLGENGQEILDQALREGLVEPLVKAEERDYEQERKDKIYEEFKTALEPTQGQYIPTVFGYFVQNEFLHKIISKKEKERLIDLAINSNLKKINPRQFKVTISDKSKRPGQYTISSIASYYGHLISLGLLLFPEDLKKFRQQIIDFIPYAYSDDQQTILSAVEKLNDSELTWVNSIYESDDDRKYLLPSSYLYIVQSYLERGCKLNTPKSVLKSFISDPYIQEYEKTQSLELLELLISRDQDHEYLQSLFDKYQENKALAEIANGILIKVFQDANAIEWRLDQIKTRKSVYKRQYDGEAHSVTELERELNDFAFAKPLIEGLNVSHIDQFIELLDFSLTLINDEEPDYFEYANYLWRVVLAYLSALKKDKSLAPLIKIESWASENLKQGKEKWFKSRIQELRKEFLNDLGQNHEVSIAIEALGEVDNA